jgi:hypothetical protein
MSDPVWEAVIEAAAEVESGGCSFNDDWRCRTRDALDAIIARFECCRATTCPRVPSRRWSMPGSRRSISKKTDFGRSWTTMIKGKPWLRPLHLREVTNA